MTVALKITAVKHTGSHPLEGEVGTKAETIKPRAGGAVLIDVSVTDGNSQVALPAFVQQLFSNINSGTIGSIDAGKGLMFTATGDAYVNYNINVQLDNTTGPFTGYFNLYFMWKWAGQNKYLNYIRLDNFNNDAWTITISGLVSMWANDLKVYMAVDNAQDEFFWWGGDFQLLVPTTNFPAFVPLVPPPLFGVGGGPPPAFPPPTPPPIGAIPVGVFAFPAVQASQVPPSVAGIPQPEFAYGSATTPPASAAFPENTTTFPVPTVVFSNVLTVPTLSGGLWTSTLPPYTHSTPPLGGSYNTGGALGPPQGPALPAVVPPRTFMVATNGDPDDVHYAEEGPAPEDENEQAGKEAYSGLELHEVEPEDEPPTHRRRGRGRRK